MDDKVNLAEKLALLDDAYDRGGAADLDVTRARSPSATAVRPGAARRYESGVLSSERHRYRAARDRYGRHGSAMRVISSGVGNTDNP